MEFVTQKNREVRMMSERIYLNNDWKFAEQFEASMTEAAYDDSTMQNVRLPHTCKETPLHYFDEHCYQMISGYRRVIEAEKEWEGKKILLTIDGAAHDSEVFLNGEKVGEHHCGYTAFTMDIRGRIFRSRGRGSCRSKCAAPRHFSPR